MKYLNHFEGKNTKNWYSLIVSDYQVEYQFYKLLENKVEDAKFYDLGKNVAIVVYLSKLEHQRNFRNWILQRDLDNFLKKVNKKEIEDIFMWIEDYETRKEAEKYNL